MREALAATSRGPYLGLDAFGEQDADLFFGRDAEAQLLRDNLLAHPVTVVYGPAGVGKSSLLEAGVVRRLRDEARRSLESHGAAEYAVVSFGGWMHEPPDALVRAARAAVAELVGHPVEGADGDLADTLRRCAHAIDGDLLVILDQFEEHLAVVGADDDPVAAALNSLLSGREHAPVSFLLSIREDAFWRLDPLRSRVPGLLSHVIRVERLDVRQAQAAIVGPLEAYNAREPGAPPVRIEPELVDVLIDGVSSGERVETSPLQLLLTRIWDAEHAAESTVLRLATLERLGGVDRLLTSYVDDAVAALSPAERDVAASVMRFIVTPSGQKVAQVAPDLADYAGVSLDVLEPVLERLAALRLLRPITPPPETAGLTRWELFNDLLGPRLRDWSRQHEEERRRAEVLPARRRERRLLIAVIFLALVVVLVTVAWAASR